MPPQTINSNNTTCYKEDGTISSDIFCGLSSLGSCCGDGWDCLSNGLCRDHGTTAYSQATCTDPTYNTQNCLAFCNQSKFGGFTEVSQCGDNSWCCAGIPGQTGADDGDCCSENPTSLQPFPFSVVLRENGKTSLPTAELATLANDQPASLFTNLTNSLGVVTGQPTPLPFTVSSSDAVPSTSSSPTRSTSTQTTSTADKASVPTQTSPSPSPPASKSGSPNPALKIGIAIAIPLGVIILAALTYLYLQNRKTRKALEHMRAQEAQKNPANTDDGESLPQEQDQAALGELDGVRNFELSNADRERHELGGMARYEMTERFSRYEMNGNDTSGRG